MVGGRNRPAAGLTVPVFDERLRPTKATLLSPVAERMPAVDADRLTGLALGFGLAAGVAAARSWWWLALVLFLAGRLFDGLDGEVARGQGATSDAGGYTDITADTLVYIAVPIGASIGSSIDHVWPITALLLASFYLNTITWAYLSAVLEKRSAAGERTTSVVMPAGLIEGTETIAFFVVMLAIPAWLDWTMAVMAAAVTVGAAIRFVQGRHRIRDASSQPAGVGRTHS